MTLAHSGTHERDAAIDRALSRAGTWLQQHQRSIQNVQWAVVGIYLFLVAVPAFLPLPEGTAHIWTNVTLFSQFAFWGLWWPFVLLSMILVGRMWCGILCPEGALTEAVSRKGHGYAVPRWVTWRGWPFVAFALTTIYGQMVSVYQYPRPVLIVLGGSTIGAMIVGYFWGRTKRVWCRYLCPVTGVFEVLSKLAPVYFRVDQLAWDAWIKPKSADIPHVNCAPLVPLKTMQGSSLCHMCGRCSGFRGAITLSRRSPNYEIVNVAGTKYRPWQSALIIFGMIGLAAGAFHWSGSAIYVAIKQFLAEALINHDIVWPLEPHLPWWILTNYPEQNDVLSILDGAVLIGFIIGMSVLVGGAISACLALAGRMASRNWVHVAHHMAQGFIPIAGCGVFLGLSALTFTMLKSEGVVLSFLLPLRMALLGGATLWTLVLCWQITGVHQRAWALRALAMLPISAGALTAFVSWASLFWK